MQGYVTYTHGELTVIQAIEEINQYVLFTV
jgi:hypothetical protein